MTKRVYIISCEGRYKIGVAKNPKKRLDELTTGNPFPLQIERVFYVNGHFPIEQKAHQILKEHNIHGEWFSCSLEEAISAVEEAKKGETNNFKDDGKPVLLTNRTVNAILTRGIGMPGWKARILDIDFPLKRGWKRKILGMEIEPDVYKQLLVVSK